MSSDYEKRLYGTLGVAYNAHVSKEKSELALTEKDCTIKATEIVVEALNDPDLEPAAAVRIEATALNFQRDILLIGNSESLKVDKKSLNIINKGLERTADALDATEKMGSYSKFESHIRDTALADFDKEGLPAVDGFRKFAKSQRVSIENQNSPASALLPSYIKNYNQVRIKLIDKALELYKEQEHGHMREFVKKHSGDRKAQLYRERNPALYQDQEKDQESER